MKWKDEKGAMTIMEATIVFPVMFFVLLFLIYMGNMFYMRSQVDAIVSNAATKAAAASVDPFLANAKYGSTIPSTIDDIKPYHNILGDASTANSVKTEMVQKLNNLGTGFFAGMGLGNITVNTFKKDNSLLSSTFIVDVTYSIEFPLRFIGSDKATVLKINSKSVAPIVDTPEFILNIDMVMDYADSWGVSEALGELKNKVGSFLGK